MRKPNWIMISIILGISLFLGYAIFTALVNAFFPAINNISRPFLCAGEYEIETIRSSYRPGEVTWSHYIYCDGKDITVASIFLTGGIVSLVFLIILLILGRNWILTDPSAPATLANAGLPEKGKDKTPLERMSELKELLDKNLISQVEYERKKDEIMKEL